MPAPLGLSILSNDSSTNGCNRPFMAGPPLSANNKGIVSRCRVYTHFGLHMKSNQIKSNQTSKSPVLSDDPVTRKFESEENSQSHTHLLCPVKVCSCLKEGTDQILTVWSDEQVASSLESGLQAKKEIRASSTNKQVETRFHHPFEMCASCKRSTSPPRRGIS
jgi:hypothetical protein